MPSASPEAAPANGSSTGQETAVPTHTQQIEKKILNMDMSDNTMIYAQTLDRIREQGVEAVLKMSDTVSWTITGSELPKEGLKDINLEAVMGESSIPFEQIEELITADEKYVELSLAHDGEFGFTAVLTLQLEEAKPGQYANLFYYNEEKKELQFMCASTVNEDGSTAFSFRHASDYVIIISDITMEQVIEQRKMADTQNLNQEQTGAEVSDNAEVAPAKEPAKAAAIIAVILLASAALVIGIYLIVSKKKDEEE